MSSKRKKKNLISNELSKEADAVEKINKQEFKQKPEKLIKERVLNIHFDSLKLTDGTIYDFAYNDNIKKSNEAEVKKYILNIKKKLSNALNLRKIIKDFEITMALNDANTKPEDKDKLPRAIKLKRLNQFYETLVDIGLVLINNFFWEDYNKQEEGTKTLEECIQLSAPMIFYLKDQFENSIHKEFLITNDELKILKN